MSNPEIDSRDMNTIIKKVEEMVPFYTPEWKFSANEQEPGTALVLSFAQMLEGIIKRFNRVPEKNFIAFLNMLGVEQLPAQPARAPVTFKLVNGAMNPVLVKVQTQLAAESEDGGDPVIFETENNILVTPAGFVTAFNVSTREDKIVAYPETFFLSPEERDKHNICLFDISFGENLQEHTAYFAHDDFLAIKSPAIITLGFGNSMHKYKETDLAARFTNPNHTRWEYWGEVDDILGWHAFDKCAGAVNEVALLKTKVGWLRENTVNGITSKWIRCIGMSQGIESLTELEFDKVNIRTDYYEKDGKSGGISPDLLFYNDKTLELKEFYPFSEYFVIGDAFYIANREVLSQKGASVTLDIDLQIHELQMVTAEHEIKWKVIMKKSDVEEKEPPKTAIAKVVWEYWNGTGWARLQTDKASETVFISDECVKTVKFVCPDDLQETFVNNYANLWLRAQIAKVDNMYAPGPKYCSPFIKSISFKFNANASGKPVEHCVTYNNLDYMNRILDYSGEAVPFKPFYSPDQSAPAFYMGFESPPQSGPISMFFSLIERKHCDEAALLEWEYLRVKRNAAKWEKLKVVDRTDSLIQSGTVVFTGPDDFAKKTLFGKELYWIRLVNADGKLDDANKTHLMPKVNGIFMNTTWVVQQETIKKGILETVKGQGNREFKIYKTPVFCEEVWIDESDNLTVEEQRRLINEGNLEINQERDDRGDITGFWVKWKRVLDFYESKEDDRHYVLDPTTGRIRFGDDKNGKIPVTYEGNNIGISYKTGGGTRGNVKAFKICNLLSSISYMDKVFNPEPAIGGSDMETVENAIRHGPEVLKHRNRAVTAEDIENLTRQVSQSITRVKCLPNYSNSEKGETGWFTVVIAPLVEEIYQRPSTELKLKVLKYLTERAPDIVAFSKHIQVIEPVYVEISIYVTLIVEDMDIVPFAEKDALEKINAFLNPTTGNYGGKGWEIGQMPHLSMFYSLLKAVRGVNYVEKVSLTASILSEGKLTEIEPNKLGEMLHILVVNGKHKVIAGV